MVQTLLLNASYEPLILISWYRAIDLMLREKVRVLESYDQSVRSAYVVFQVPAVVVLKNYVPDRHRVKFNRKNVFLRDDFTCQYCGKPIEELRNGAKDLTFDHVLPRCQGGKTSWKNIVTACKKCNSTKGGRTPEQAWMSLKTKPYKPTPHFLFTAPLKGKKSPEEWDSYLYWE